MKRQNKVTCTALFELSIELNLSPEQIKYLKTHLDCIYQVGYYDAVRNAFKARESACNRVRNPAILMNRLRIGSNQSVTKSFPLFMR